MHSGRPLLPDIILKQFVSRQVIILGRIVWPKMAKQWIPDHMTHKSELHSPKVRHILTPSMTGLRFHCAMEIISALPWWSKSPSQPPLLNKVQDKGRMGCEQGTTRNSLRSFPLSGTPVVQSRHVGHNM